MQMIGLIRLGRDAELKQTPAGSLLSFSGVYDMRVRGEKVSQWVEFAMFGKRAEALAQYMTKGKQVVVSASAPRVRRRAVTIARCSFTTSSRRARSTSSCCSGWKARETWSH